VETAAGKWEGCRWREAKKWIPGLNLRLYRDLAEWYPLLTPVEDYAEEADLYRRLFISNCPRPPRTLLDLGSGPGHNAAYLKRSFACTLLDLEPAMLELSRRLNPECSHVQGDMRSISSGGPSTVFSSMMR
jgi:Trans-aconitate methyltransferase